MYDDIIDKASKETGLPKPWIMSLIKTESNWNPNAISKSGAQGLTQLMPTTANELGVTNPFDPEQNILGGARYLKKQIDLFGPDKGFMAYNAGPGNIQKGIIPAETQAYLPKIQENIQLYGGDMGEATQIAGQQNKVLNQEQDAMMFRKMADELHAQQAKAQAAPAKEPSKKKIGALDVIIPLLATVSGGMALGPMGLALGALGGIGMKSKMDIENRKVGTQESMADIAAKEQMMKEPQQHFENLVNAMAIEESQRRAKKKQEMMDFLLKRFGTDTSTRIPTPVPNTNPAVSEEKTF